MLRPRLAGALSVSCVGLLDCGCDTTSIYVGDGPAAAAMSQFIQDTRAAALLEVSVRVHVAGGGVLQGTRISDPTKGVCELTLSGMGPLILQDLDVACVLAAGEVEVGSAGVAVGRADFAGIRKRKEKARRKTKPSCQCLTNTTLIRGPIRNC